VRDRLSRGPCKAATGWSARTLLSLWWGDPGRNDRGTAATGARRADSNTTARRCARASAVADTTTARNSAAASSNASSAVAVRGDSVVSASRATAAGATVHANAGAGSVRLTPDARNSSSTCSTSDDWRDAAL
jgi:hypothetical protein